MIPCELVVKKVLPAVRKSFAQKMLSDKNAPLSQREVARELGLTEAAVSQYLSEKRAGGKNAIKEFAQVIDKYYGKKISFEKKVCLICKELRSTKSLCALHLKDGFSPSPRSCGICNATC